MSTAKVLLQVEPMTLKKWQNEGKTLTLTTTDFRTHEEGYEASQWAIGDWITRWAGHSL
jgi:hypothetical protein